MRAGISSDLSGCLIAQSLNHSSLVRGLLEFQQGRPQLLGNLERSDPKQILLGGLGKPLPTAIARGSRTKDAGLLTARKTILSWGLLAIYWGRDRPNPRRGATSLAKPPQQPGMPWGIGAGASNGGLTLGSRHSDILAGEVTGRYKHYHLAHPGSCHRRRASPRDLFRPGCC